jgi:predicted metal-dependent phosphoesterase TrpH
MDDPDATASPLHVDLQSHSVHSDGELTPTDVVARAAAAGVTLLALTDHDTVAGVGEAIAAGERHGVRVVPATELSIVDEAAEDLHILGYGLDHESPELLERLDAYRDDRRLRADRMLARLAELGFAIDEAAIDARRADGGPIGRPHLAKAVLGHPDNAERLAAEGLRDVGDVIRGYLIAGRPAFLGRTMPDVHEAVDLIHRAGGVAVWAHPFWDIDGPDAVLAVLDRFAAAGIDGIEAFYVTHSAEQTAIAADAGERLGLLLTCSADFHGPDHALFSRFLAYELHGRRPRLGAIGASSA